MNHLDLFSGIGGFAYALDQVYENNTHTFCEIDLFCQEVLKKHWPEAEIYGDIRTLTYANHWRQKEQELQATGNKQHNRIFILTGGFPCQPFSQAGRRKGTDDNRHLWPEMFRVIREFRPEWVIAENVAGLLTIQQGVVFGQVLTDLESENYEVQTFVIPAVAVNAPHKRNRIWIVAHTKSSDDRGKLRDLSGKDEAQPEPQELYEKTTSQFANAGFPGWKENWSEVAARLCRVDDGLPRRLDRNPRLKALGNAIVPQVAEEIIRAIKESNTPEGTIK